MRRFAGWVALAMMCLGGPLAAQEATIARTEGPAAERPTEGAVAKIAAASAPLELAALPLLEQLPPPPPPPPPITLVLKADLGSQRLTVIENGKQKYVWLISSGRAGYATKTGTFRPQWASRMWYSRQYEYAPMPHAVFFHRGTAFHGTGAVGLLGRAASHGCIRLAPGNAAQLFNLVHKHGYAQTKVVVHGGPKIRGTAVADRSEGRRGGRFARSQERKGYDAGRYRTRSASNWPF